MEFPKKNKDSGLLTDHNFVEHMKVKKIKKIAIL